MNRREFTRRAMFGLFGGAAAVTAEAAPQKGRFPQKNRFRHKTGLGFYDFAWSGWNQIYNQPVCCAQWYAAPIVDPSGPVWALTVKNKYLSGSYYTVQSDAWSYREDLSDIDLNVYQVLTRRRVHPAFYSSTTGTAGQTVSPSYVVDTTLIEGHPLITAFSTHKQKADSRLESYDRLMKMIEDFDAAPAIKHHVLREGFLDENWKKNWNAKESVVVDEKDGK